jgi:hypothetical protein
MQGLLEQHRPLVMIKLLTQINCGSADLRFVGLTANQRRGAAFRHCVLGENDAYSL